MDDHGARRYNTELVLIEWLISRTERGRLSWKIDHDKVTTSVSLPPLVHLRFDSHVDAAGKHGSWSCFSFRSEHLELLQINPNHALDEETTLLDAANTLFIAALKSTGRREGRTPC